MLLSPVVDIETDKPDRSIVHGFEAVALESDLRCIGNSDLSLPRADDCLTIACIAAPIAISNTVGSRMSSMTLQLIGWTIRNLWVDSREMYIRGCPEPSHGHSITAGYQAVCGSSMSTSCLTSHL